MVTRDTGRKRLSFWKTRPALEATFLLLLFILTLYLRLGYSDHLPQDYLTSDEEVYDAIARNFVMGKGLAGVDGAPTSMRQPFPSLFFSGVYFLSGQDIYHVRTAQALLGSVSGLFIYLVGRRLFSRKVGAVSYILFAFNPMLIGSSGMLMRETFTVFVLALLVYLLLLLKEQKSIFLPLFSGVVWGVLVLTNPIGVFLIPFILLYLILYLGDWRRFIKVSLPILAMVLLFWSAWIARNYTVHDRLILFTTWDGTILHQYNAPEVERSDVLQLPEDTQKLSEEARNAELIRRSLDSIRENPIYYLRLVRERIPSFWNHTAIEGYFTSKEIWLFGQPVATIWQFNDVFLRMQLPWLVLLGMLISIFHWRRCSILYLLFVSFTIFHGLFGVFMQRFRIPIMPYEMIFAALGIVSVPTLAYKFWLSARSERGIARLKNAVLLVRQRIWVASIALAGILGLLFLLAFWGRQVQDIFDDTPPTLSLDMRENGHDLSNGKKVLLISGYIEAGSHLVITQNGERVEEVVAEGSVLRKEILLGEGKNDIVVEASDRAGNKTKREYTFFGDDLSLGEYAYLLVYGTNNRAIPLKKVALTDNGDLASSHKVNPSFQISFPDGEPIKFTPQPKSSGTIYEELTDGLTAGSGYYTWESVRWKGATLEGGYGHMVRSILFAFEKEQYITDVIIKSPTPYSAYRVSQVDVSVSNDGQKFQKVGSDAIINSYWVQGLDTLAIEGIEKSARYVKLDVHKLGTDMLVSEVFILGLVDEEGRSPTSPERRGVITKLAGVREKVPIRDESNLKRVPNSGFEEDGDNNGLPDRWGGAQWAGVTDYALDDSVFVEGSRSVRLETLSAGVNFGLISDPLAVVPGKAYYLSGRMKTSSGTTPSNMEVQFLSPDKKQVGLDATAVVRSGEWAELGLEGTVPGEAAYAVLRLRIFNSQRAGEMVWFDDMKLYGEWD